MYSMMDGPGLSDITRLLDVNHHPDFDFLLVCRQGARLKIVPQKSLNRIFMIFPT